MLSKRKFICLSVAHQSLLVELPSNLLLLASPILSYISISITEEEHNPFGCYQTTIPQVADATFDSVPVHLSALDSLAKCRQPSSQADTQSKTVQIPFNCTCANTIDRGVSGQSCASWSNNVNSSLVWPLPIGARD